MRKSKRSIWSFALALAIATCVMPRVASADTYVVDVRTFGATGDGLSDDTAAIQRANDDVASHGGGRVSFPSGTYIASRVVQDSGVELHGESGATLKHPDGTSGPIVTNRRVKTSGAIAKGSNSITLADASAAAPGRSIAIQGAAGASSAQRTTLAQALTSTDTKITLSQWAGFATASTLVVEGEVIAYTVVGPGDVRVFRGLYGTQAVPHAAGAVAAELSYLHARVVAVDGSIVTIDRPATLSVSNTPVYFGADDIALTGFTIDGNRPGRGSASGVAVPVDYLLVRRARIADNVIRNGDHGAIKLDTYSTDSVIENNTLIDDGSAAGTHGAAIWLFRGATGNTIRNNTIGGDAYHGIFVDDRTQLATLWDAGSSWNLIENNTIDIAPSGNAAMLVVGASDNTIRNNVVRRTTMGIRIERSEQGVGTTVDSQRNVVERNGLSQHSTALRITGSSNRSVWNTKLLSTTPYSDLGTGNTNELLPTTTTTATLARTALKLSATVTDAMSRPVAGGKLVFWSGSTKLCSATTDANGKATCTVSATTRTKIKNLDGKYAGDVNYVPSTGRGTVL